MTWPIIWTFLKANKEMAALGLAVLIVSGLWVGMNHYRHQAEDLKDIAHSYNEALKSVDRHADFERKTTNTVQQQSEILRKLPDAEKPIDPVRRDALKRSIDCVRTHKPASCSVSTAVPSP